MTRLINADKVLKKAETMYVAIDSSLNSVLAVNAYDIKHAPTVEAIPIKWLYEQSDNPDRSDAFRNACDLVAMAWRAEREEDE